MRLDLAAVAAVALAACGQRDAPTAGPPAMPRVVADPPCGYLQPAGDFVYEGSITELASDLQGEGAVVRFTDDHPAVRALAAEGPLRFVFDIDCPSIGYQLGDGVVGDLRVVIAATPGGVRFPGAYVVRDGNAFVVHAVPPRALFDGMAVRKVEAELWVASRRRWATVDLDLEVETADGRLVLEGLQLEVRGGPTQVNGQVARDGLRLVGLDVGGVSRIAGGELEGVVGGDEQGTLVLERLPVGISHVHLRLEGWPDVLDERNRDGRTLLARWLPAVPFQDSFARDVTLHHPADEGVVMANVASPPEQRTGWTTIELHDVGNAELVVLAAPKHLGAPLAFEPSLGTRITIAGAHDGPACQAALAHAAAALAPLGPLGDLVVHATAKGGWSAPAGRLILIDPSTWQSVCADASSFEVRALARELAHTLFGVEVSPDDDEADALAEYASAWVLSADQAKALRSIWTRDDDRGALLMSSLEDRIGRDRMAATLRRFVADRRGHAGSWMDVAAAVRAEAGDAEATWFEGRLRSRD